MEVSAKSGKNVEDLFSKVGKWNFLFIEPFNKGKANSAPQPSGIRRIGAYHDCVGMKRLKVLLLPLR